MNKWEEERHSNVAREIQMNRFKNHKEETICIRPPYMKTSKERILNMIKFHEGTHIHTFGIIVSVTISYAYVWFNYELRWRKKKFHVQLNWKKIFEWKFSSFARIIGANQHKIFPLSTYYLLIKYINTL